MGILGNMKILKLQQWFIFLSCVILICGCSSENDLDLDSSSNDDIKITNIRIEILTEPQDKTEPFPRMVATVDDWNIIEYTNYGMDYEEMMTLHFLNPEKKISMLVTCYGNTAMFIGYNPFTNIRSDTVVIAADKQGYTCLATCLMDWGKNTFTILSEMLFEESSAQKRSIVRRTDDSEEFRDQTAKLLDKLCKDISKVSKIPSKFKSSVGYIASIWTKAALPMAKYSLYSENPVVQQKIQEEYVKDQSEEYIVDIMPSNMSKLYEAVKKVYSMSLTLFDRPSDEEITDDHVNWITYRTSSLASTTGDLQSTYATMKSKYKVMASIKSLDETSVTIDASYRCIDGQPSFISEFGIELIGPNNQKQTKKIPNFENDIVFKDLTPGATYYASAYLLSLGTRYEYSFSFTTKITFSLYPTVLSFPQEGASKSVTLMIPEEGIKSWKIKSKPQWCDIEKGRTSFFVDVAETNESRTGEIVVQATLHDNSFAEASVKVEQKVAAWDGTSWSFNGSVNVSGDVQYAGYISMAQISNFGIAIESVENNKFSLTGDLAGYNDNSRIYCDDQNNLIWTSSQTIYQPGCNVNVVTQIYFTRTGSESAIGKLNGSAQVSLSSQYFFDIGMNGTFSGTLQTQSND